MRLQEIEDVALSSPFPPMPLMYRVSGLTNSSDFAKHSRDIFCALNAASPVQLMGYGKILDFGVGSGRLARMFKYFGGRYLGVDVDHELLAWVAKALPWVTIIPTKPKEPLPIDDNEIDCVISVSVFSHMAEADSLFYLHELHRIMRWDGIALLTVHGQRSLDRASNEPAILEMLSISASALEQARKKLDNRGFAFVPQESHLADTNYEYGMTFISNSYIQSKWTELFSVRAVLSAAIYDFQDIIVLSKRACGDGR